VTMTLHTQELSRALDELQRAFPGRVSVAAEEPNGAVIKIEDVELSERWSASTGHLWFLIPFHYPDAPIYPYYVTDATPNGGFVQALQPVSWRGMPATQVSLRHNSWSPTVDTALGSVRQAIAWLCST
jgi:hypothetical protein